MLIKETYVCEVCKEEYTDKEKAKECEASHKEVTIENLIASFKGRFVDEGTSSICTVCPFRGSDCVKKLESKVLEYLEEFRSEKNKLKRSEDCCLLCENAEYTIKPFTVINPSGVRREIIFSYCPNCGRKL